MWVFFTKKSLNFDFFPISRHFFLFHTFVTSSRYAKNQFHDIHKDTQKLFIEKNAELYVNVSLYLSIYALKEEKNI